MCLIEMSIQERKSNWPHNKNKIFLAYLGSKGHTIIIFNIGTYMPEKTV